MIRDSLVDLADVGNGAVRLTGHLDEQGLFVERVDHPETSAWDAQPGKGTDLDVASASAMQVPTEAAKEIESVGVSPAEDGFVAVVQLRRPVPAVERWAADQGPTKVRLYVFIRESADA
ncbi:hypothetical protein FB459_2813 [Yimella lutea]|uniref:Uncharacterized protein n=1 Tax=Yimella lutea TaxID=587872 RepID=A0A542EJ10_9MICO|nr:hypothetical protein [Yimella lutea]TQJ15274.1 hypothetical protein FB459_2813 [Yimella lutea]